MTVKCPAEARLWTRPVSGRWRLPPHREFHLRPSYCLYNCLTSADCRDTPSMGSTISAEVLELIDNRLEYQVSVRPLNLFLRSNLQHTYLSPRWPWRGLPLTS